MYSPPMVKTDSSLATAPSRKQLQNCNNISNQNWNGSISRVFVWHQLMHITNNVTDDALLFDPFLFSRTLYVSSFKFFQNSVVQVSPCDFRCLFLHYTLWATFSKKHRWIFCTEIWNYLLVLGSLWLIDLHRNLYKFRQRFILRVGDKKSMQCWNNIKFPLKNQPTLK